ncbi:hypothetical protein ACVWZ4_002489 [Bradyrhizobium sp. USDA 4472]
MSKNGGDRQMLEELAALLPTLRDPSKTVRIWHEGKGKGTMDDPITIGFYEEPEVVHRFAVTGSEFVRFLGPMDWNKWAQGREGNRLLHELSSIAHANSRQLAKITYTLARSDRFIENTLGQYLEDGFLLAIAERAQNLLDTSVAE